MLSTLAGRPDLQTVRTQVDTAEDRWTMDKHLDLDPSKAFPAEVLELAEQGIPLPTWYSGPLYTGNGTGAAVRRLQEERERASAPPPNQDNEEPAF